MRRWLLFVLLVIPFVVMLALVVEADDPSPEEGAPRNICLDPDTGDFLCPPTATPTPVPTLDPETCISHPQYCLTPAPTATPTPKPPTATPTPKPPTATPTPKPPTATPTPEPPTARPTATAEPEATSAYLNPRPYNVRFDNRPTQWHEFTVKARGGAVYVRVNPTLTYTRLEISATDSPGDLCPPTRQQRIKRVEGDNVYLAACSVGETYVELYTEGGTMKARYRVDVQRYTPSITPTPSPTAPPTATATAMATPTDTCPRPPGQGVVALGLGQQTIRGRWDGNDCLHFPVTASTRLHIVLMLRSFGRDPEVSLLEGVGTGGAELAHNDDTLEGSGEESLLGRTVPAGGYTVRAEINRAPLSGSTYQLVIEAALKYAHAGHHQEDGNVEYTGPTVAAGANPLPAWADTLVEDMADQWEAASNGLVELCEAGTCSGSPEGLITPIEVVVGSRSNDPPSRTAPGCGRTIACVMYGEPPSSGHMGALTFRIESPAYSAGRLVTWTDVPALNNAVVGVDYYRYLPSVLSTVTSI